MLKKLGVLSASCGSGNKLANYGAGAPVARPSYFNDVMKKLRSVEDLQGCSVQDIESMVEELTDVEQLWSIYFSGVILDPARDRIDLNLMAEAENGATLGAGLPAKLIALRCKYVRDSSQYGVQTFSSLLHAHYGPIHASLLVGGAVILEWGVSGVVIPARRAIQSATGSASRSMMSGATVIAAPERQGAVSREEEILHEFEATIGRKEQVYKLLEVVVKYNKNYLYHPILRNCQKFVSDCLSALGQSIPPKLTGTLGDYLKEVKKGRKRKVDFESHADLDAYVERLLESNTATLEEREYLLAQYFSFHVTSMTDSTVPERWSCGVASCHMSELEQSVDLKSTSAYCMFS